MAARREVGEHGAEGIEEEGLGGGNLGDPRHEGREVAGHAWVGLQIAARHDAPPRRLHRARSARGDGHLDRASDTREAQADHEHAHGGARAAPQAIEQIRRGEREERARQRHGEADVRGIRARVGADETRDREGQRRPKARLAPDRRPGEYQDDAGEHEGDRIERDQRRVLSRHPAAEGHRLDPGVVAGRVPDRGVERRREGAV